MKKKEQLKLIQDYVNLLGKTYIILLSSLDEFFGATLSTNEKVVLQVLDEEPISIKEVSIDLQPLLGGSTGGTQHSTWGTGVPQSESLVTKSQPLQRGVLGQADSPRDSPCPGSRTRAVRTKRAVQV